MLAKERLWQYVKTVTARFMEENRLMINMESRILGDEYVRFGGERLGRFHILIWFRTFRLACGGGKTLIMCCGTYEKKRIGLVNKPMITGLKANIHEIAKTFCTAYPMARVLIRAARISRRRSASRYSGRSRTTTGMR